MRRLLAGTLVAIALAAPTVARAQSKEDMARADSLFGAAKALLDSGQNAEACGKFAESKRLAPGLGVTLYLADCYERIGRYASAWTEFRAAEGLARERGDKRADVARDRAQALEPKLNRMTITVGPTVPHAGLQILLDGATVSPEEWGLPAPVDSGDHVVVVSSQGQVRRTFKSHLGSENPNTTVSVDSLDEPAAAPAPATVDTTPPPAAGPAPVDVPVATSDPGATRRWIGIGTGIAGIVGLGVGGVFGLSAKSELDKSNNNTTLCTKNPDSCTTAGQAVRNQAGTDATLATVFVVVGAAAVAAGIVVYVTAPHADSPTAATALQLAPAALPGGGGAILAGTF